MKKFLSLFAIIGLLFSIGCGGGDAPADDDKKDAPAGDDKKDAPAADAPAADAPAADAPAK